MQSDFTLGQKRYWPGVSRDGTYTYFEPLTAEELASQRATSAYWRNWGNGLAEGAGQASAAYPLAGEAVYDAYKVFTDLASDIDYYRNRSGERGFVQVQPHKRGQSMSGPGGYLFTGRQRSTGYLPSGSIATGAEPRGKRSRREFAGDPRNLGRDFDMADGGVTAAGGMLSLPRIKRRSGRKQLPSRKMRKILKAEMQSMIYRFQGYQQYSGFGNGLYSLSNYVNTATATGTDGHHWLPWHVYDVTTCINRVDGNSSLVTYTPFGYQCMLTYGNTATPGIAGIAWRPIPGSLNDGTNYNRFNVQTETVVQRNDGQSLMVPGNRSVLDWIDLKMIMYGNTTTQSTFEIALIQFIDEDFQPGFSQNDTHVPETFTNPEFNPTTNIIGVTQYNNDANVRRRVAEWMRPWISSPIATRTGGDPTKPFMKFLWRKKFTLPAKPTYNPDTNSPQMLQFQNFFNMNRLCKWDWNFQDSGIATTAGQATRMQEDSFRVIDTNTNNQPYLDPKARVYLSIRANPLFATNSTPNATGAYNIFTGQTTSYDMVVRTKHSMLVN